jgi:hypothetical protein
MNLTSQAILKTALRAVFLPLFLVTALFGRAPVWAGPVRMLESGPGHVLIEAAFEGERFQPLEGAPQGHVLLTAPGCAHSSEPGAPMLPQAGVLLGVPPQGQPRAEVIEEEWETISTDPICPAPDRSEPDSRLSDSPRWTMRPDAAVYGHDRFFPSRLVRIETAGRFRDYRVARLQIFPFRYNPVSGQLRICRRLVVRVDLGGQEPAETPPGIDPGSLPSTDRPAGAPPSSPAAERIASLALLNHSQARAWRIPRAGGEDRPAAKTELAPRCRITLTEDGIYSIGREELLEAELDIDAIDPRTFQLTNKGKTIPLYVTGEKDGSFDPGDAIEFHGTANRFAFQEKYEDIYQDPFASENVYWLSWGQGPGARLLEENGGIQATALNRPISFIHTVHAEEDNYRDHLNKQMAVRDHWFWDSGISAQGMRTYSLKLDHPDRNSPQRPVVRVMMHGLTSVEEADPDHHVLVYLNDHLVADRTWDGQEKLLIDSAEQNLEITSSAVEEEENVLTIICPGDTEAGAIDRVLLNWIEVDYPRLYRAAEDELAFSHPDRALPDLFQFTLTGFTGPPVRIFKPGSSVITNAQGEWIEEEDGERRYQVTFQDEIFTPRSEYLAVAAGARKKVASLELRPATTLGQGGRGADMIMVVHDDFLEHALPLAEHRRGQGLEVEVIPVSEVYDAFSDGLFTPLAIRDFLTHAYHHWDPAPVYALLIGDGSWDYKNTLGLGQNFIPPIMTQTLSWGQTPCDNLYACVSGDDLVPDLFIGRLPVQTNGQLDAVIEKIIRAETQPELGDWRRRLLFICGSGDHGPIFRAQSENLIADHVPPDFLVSRIYAHSDNPVTDPFFGGTQDLIDALDQGAALVNFIGHGGGGIWSDAGLMRLEDVERLRNEPRWPVVASLTCFTCAFDEPKRASLGEQLLLSENRGVTGFWGASGLAWLYGDYYLNNELMEALWADRNLHLGQLVTEAKLQYLAAYGGQIAQDLVNEYILLGDPASRISLPQGMVELTIEPEAVDPGQTMEIQGTVTLQGEPSGAAGQAQLEILDRSETVLWESALAVDAGRIQTTATIPPQALSGPGTVRCYFWNQNDGVDAAGSAAFSLDQAFFDTLYTDPSQPIPDRAVDVLAVISATGGIDSVRCRWKAGALDSTVAMTLQAPGTYRTADPIAPQPRGSTVRYWVTAVDSAGRSTGSPAMSYRILSGPDLQIRPENITSTAEQGAGIAVTVRNLGETGADSVLVRASLGTAAERRRRQTREAVIDHLPPASRDTVFLSWDLPAGSYTVRAEADPENRIDEGNENNNLASQEIQVQQYDITPQDGSVVDGAHAPARSLDGNFSADIPPAAVSRRQVMRITSLEPRVNDQPDLSPARLLSGQTSAYRLALVDSTASLAGSAQILLTFRLDPADSLNQEHRDDLFVYRWNETIERWIRQPSEPQWSADSLTVTVSGLGLFCPMINRDRQAPTIELTVEEQYFSPGALVSRDARIVAVIQDANGVDSQERTIEVQANGQPVAAEDLMIMPLAETNSLPVSYSPTWPTGRHSVTFSAYDCNGNAAARTMSFEVNDSYGIDQMGNYPNPFDEETVITYRLTGPVHAEEISLKIYTVSGRLIRSWRDFLDEYGLPGTQLDHHVISWDGRDGDGHPLANGVYFYKIRARWEEQTVERVGKMAILR